MKYKDITHQDIIKILIDLKLDNKYIETLNRRVNKYPNITIDKLVKEIYKSKGIDIRKQILYLRLQEDKVPINAIYEFKKNIKNNLVSKIYYKHGN